MNHRILTPIEASANDQPAQLFNNYLFRLKSLEAVTIPYQSMAGYAALLAQDEAEGTEHAAEMNQRLYHLHRLNLSLNQLHDCLTQASIELETFVGEGLCLDTFAALSRSIEVELQGSDDPQDFNPDGSVRLRDEAEALAPYRLPVRLRQYFVGSPGGGETIGASGPADFAYFSNLVGNGLVFRLRDASQPARADNLSTYRQDEAQELGITEMEQPEDERFDQVDYSLSGQMLVEQFDKVLVLCQEAATVYASLVERGEEVAGYKYLYRLIEQITGGQFLALRAIGGQ